MALTPGFDAAEATELLKICALLNNTTVKGDKPPAALIKSPLKPVPEPTQWVPFYKPDSSFGAGDNYFEIWQNKNDEHQYALCFRGTTNALGSILEDTLAFMVPASISFKLFGEEHTVGLAKDSGAHVHAGFAGGLATMLPDVYLQMEKIVLKNVGHPTDFFIIGHSQGAALATLCRSFLHYQTLQDFEKINYKTYVFAQPKPGDAFYGYDFDHIVCNNNAVNSMGFRITNTQDWVPQSPFAIETPNDWSLPNPLSTGLESLPSEINKILKDIENLKLPTTLNYVGCGTQIILEGTPGTNPDDPNDFFWQHHGTHYYKLLTEQFPVSSK